MDNKKDIGELFKERLDSLESKPNDAIWDALEKKLKKDNRRTFPFWLKLTSLGVLAFLLGLTLYQINTSNTNTNTLNKIEKTNTLKTTESNINNNNEDNLLLKTDTLNNIIGNANLANDSLLTKENSTAQNNANATTQNSNLKSQRSNVTLTSQQRTLSKLNNSGLSSNSIAGSNTKEDSHPKTRASSRTNTSSNATSNGLSQKYDKTKTVLLGASSIISESVLDIFGLIALDDLKIKLDLIPFSNESDEKSETVAAKQNYSIETFGGPLLFSAPSNSSLDNQLNTNKKSGNVSFNYGAAIRFKLSKRTSIKIGIAKTDLVYVTESVASTNEDGSIISLNNILGLDLDFAALDSINNNNVLGGNAAVDLRQEYSYLEVPIEMDYRLVDKKINIDVFGGLSLLALTNNTIYAQSANSNKINIGKANNLNKLNLSLNTGTNFSTQLFENIDLNLRPTFKYYFKTVGKSNIKFNPFTFGINVGLSYSF